MQDQRFKLKSQMMLEGDAGGEGMVLIDGHSGSMCACNASAVVMLELLKRGASQPELARELAQKFAISASRSAGDARGFLQSLGAMGAIEMVEAQKQGHPNFRSIAASQPA